MRSIDGFMRIIDGFMRIIDGFMRIIDGNEQLSRYILLRVASPVNNPYNQSINPYNQSVIRLIHERLSGYIEF